jgi:hypothetical protein
MRVAWHVEMLGARQPEWLTCIGCGRSRDAGRQVLRVWKARNPSRIFRLVKYVPADPPPVMGNRYSDSIIRALAEADDLADAVVRDAISKFAADLDRQIMGVQVAEQATVVDLLPAGCSCLAASLARAGH